MKTIIRVPLIAILALQGGLIASPAWAVTENEIQKLLASDGAALDEFGFSVAVDENTAVIASDLDDDNGLGSGSAYVFTRSEGVWTEQQKLTASDGASLDFFGGAIAVDGNTAVIGVRKHDQFGSNAGAAYVFTRSAGVWTEQQKLIASDSVAGDMFGSGVALDGNTAVISFQTMISAFEVRHLG